MILPLHGGRCPVCHDVTMCVTMTESCGGIAETEYTNGAQELHGSVEKAAVLQRVSQHVTRFLNRVIHIEVPAGSRCIVGLSRIPACGDLDIWTATRITQT